MMEKWHMNFSLTLLFLFILSPYGSGNNESSTSKQPLDFDVCRLVRCGQGTCVPSDLLLGFDCECYSGWKKIQIGPLTFPSCVIPNCTVDLSCGKEAALPPQPVNVPAPSFNLSNPCNMVWCNEGTCLPNGNAHMCQCNDVSKNFLNNNRFPCFKQCSFGADCTGLIFGDKPSPPPPIMSVSTGNSSSALASSQTLRTSPILLLAATFFVWL